MFRVLSFSLGVRIPLSVEGAGHMPRRCAATELKLSQLYACLEILVISRKVQCWGKRCNVTKLRCFFQEISQKIPKSPLLSVLSISTQTISAVGEKVKNRAKKQTFFNGRNISSSSIMMETSSFVII